MEWSHEYNIFQRFHDEVVSYIAKHNKTIIFLVSYSSTYALYYSLLSINIIRQKILDFFNVRNIFQNYQTIHFQMSSIGNQNFDKISPSLLFLALVCSYLVRRP